MSALPYIKWFPSDWLSDERLRLVSFAARGLWIDMLCLMAKNERRGFLEVKGGVKPTLAQLAKLTCSTELEIGPLLDEIIGAGVCSVEPETGVLFSRRLVRDTRVYNEAVKYGRKGGNPALKNGASKRVNPPLKLREQPSLGSGYGNNDDSCLEGLGDGANGANESSGHVPKAAASRERNPLLDALASVDGSDPLQVTGSAWPTIATALKHIRAVTPDVTPEEIRRRRDNYVANNPTWACTPSSLAKHWAAAATLQPKLQHANNGTRNSRGFENQQDYSGFTEKL